MRGTSIGCSFLPPTGILPRNPGMCPDWEANGDLSVRRPALNPWGHTSQGQSQCYYFKKMENGHSFSCPEISIMPDIFRDPGYQVLFE